MTPIPPPPDTTAEDSPAVSAQDPFPAFIVTTTGDEVVAGVSTLALDDLPPGDRLRLVGIQSRRSGPGRSADHPS